MDININVRAIQGERQTNTSVDKQVSNKKLHTPKTKNIKSKKPKITEISAKSAAKVFLPLYLTSQIKQKTFSTLNRANRIAGTITGNRFGESRRRDALCLASNPFAFARSAAVNAFQGFYETQRQNKRIDYTRKISGMSFPYREGNNGITI
jgi:hypothetical protein